MSDLSELRLKDQHGEIHKEYATKRDISTPPPHPAEPQKLATEWHTARQEK